MGFKLFYTPKFKLHAPESAHPESPDRLTFIENAFQKKPSSSFSWVSPSRQVEDQDLLRVHSQRLVDEIKASSKIPFTQLDPDTYACQESDTISRLAAGASLEALDFALSNKGVGSFVLVRPPGHHAEKDRSMGFCLFNNIAVATAFALDQHHVKRIAIFDFDVHHGNGTQEIFYSSSSVLYLSCHQFPWYPGTGNWNEIGSGKGSGFSVNFPLPAGAGDSEFLASWDYIFEKRLNSFQPELLVISAGYDAHEKDPLSTLNVSTEGFFQLSLRINQWVKAKNIPFFYVLEGGYHPTALPEGVWSAIQAHESDQLPTPISKLTPETQQLCETVLEAHRFFWT